MIHASAFVRSHAVNYSMHTILQYAVDNQSINQSMIQPCVRGSTCFCCCDWRKACAKSDGGTVGVVLLLLLLLILLLGMGCNGGRGDAAESGHAGGLLFQVGGWRTGLAALLAAAAEVSRLFQRSSTVSARANAVLVVAVVVVVATAVVSMAHVAMVHWDHKNDRREEGGVRDEGTGTEALLLLLLDGRCKSLSLPGAAAASREADSGNGRRRADRLAVKGYEHDEHEDVHGAVTHADTPEDLADSSSGVRVQLARSATERKDAIEIMNGKRQTTGTRKNNRRVSAR